MFALRRISGQGIEMNHSLGDGYTVVGRLENYEEFARSFKKVFNKDHVADLDPESDDHTKRVFAFVSGQNGSFVQPLYSNQQNYIMTESGKTFSCLKP